MVKLARRRCRLKLQIHRDAVALVSAYLFTGSIEGEALLVIHSYYFFQQSAADGKAVCSAGGEEIVHTDPAAGFKYQA